MDLEGTRPSELARRLGVSKEAIGEPVDEKVATGMVERVTDPTDGRAVLVRFLGGVDALAVADGPWADRGLAPE